MKRLFLVALFTLYHTVSLAAIAEVASMRASGEYTNVASSAALSFPNNVTAGQLLVAAGVNWNATTQTLVFSGCSTTWAVVQGADQSGNGGVYKTFIAYGIAGASGPCTPTADPAGTGNYGSYSLDAFSGVNATPLDADGGDSTGTGTTPSDSITTGTANALILAVMSHTDGVADRTLTPGGTMTQFGEIESVANAPHNAEFRIVTSATSYTPDWTVGTSVTWRAQTLSAKEATASGPDMSFIKRRIAP